MTANEVCHLEALPTELNISIMGDTTSPIALFNPIIASPEFHGVFASSKQPILSGLINQKVHPDVLIDAQVAAEASLPKGKQKTFLLDYEEKKKAGPVRGLIPLSSCTAICRLLPSVGQFVQEPLKRIAIVPRCPWPFSWTRWPPSVLGEGRTNSESLLPLSAAGTSPRTHQ